MTLLNYIKQYTENNPLPMHMPGHKRNINMFPYLNQLTAECDLTEIPPMDDLHAPEGIIKSCQRKAEKLWHSRNSYFLVNGSTCGILAGIRGCTNTGDKVLVARNCHKSVYNAIELCQLQPIYIIPSLSKDLPIYTSINVEAITQALNKNEDIKLVIITSPTYEGVISDIKEIVKICHNKNIPVLVDEAHGAHLNLSPFFTNGAVMAGADIVIQSLHKTLPSLTQTAILHLNSNLIPAQKIKRQLAIFQTSSPSYLLMSSIDSCITALTENPKLFHHWENNLKYFQGKVCNLKKLFILNYTHPTGNDIFAFDNSKIIISTSKTNINSIQLANLLKNKYNIELEMFSGDYCVAMTGIGDSKENLSTFADALLEIDNSIDFSTSPTICTSISNLPPTACTISIALSRESQVIPLENSLNKISAEYIWVYPPGIPLITPGEIITNELIKTIKTAISYNMNLQKTFSMENNEISVIADS